MSLSESLITAAKNGNTKEVRKLLGKGALFTKDQFGNTALHEAAWNGNNDIVKILLNKSCFVDSINNTGFTPLHLASQNGHAKVVKTLFKWKASSSLLNQHGETALHLVAKYDHANVVPSFTAHKVSLDLKGKDGNTALHIAAKLGNVETTKAILAAGAHPAISNDMNLRPYDYAERSGYSALAKLISLATQKHKPKLQSNGANVSSAVPIAPLSPQNNGYSLSQPEEYSMSHSFSQPVGDLPSIHGIKPRAQRTMSASAKLSDVRPSVNKHKRKKSQREKEEATAKLTGSLSPTPHKYFSSQDELDTSGIITGKERSVGGLPADHKQPTIDQLLSEIETESYGPGYKYKPQYTEGNNLRHPLSVTKTKVHFQSTRNEIEDYDIVPTTTNGYEYDYPKSHNSNSNSNNSPLGATNQIQVQTEHAHYQSPRMFRRLPSPPASPPNNKFKHHTYEPLLPKEDGDTYVYMAPLSDYPELLQQEYASQARNGGSLSPRASDSQSLVSESGSDLSGSSSTGGIKSGKRVVAVRDPPDRRHKTKEPVKGILIQSSIKGPEKSELEDYLQKELETMGQAFQIRLNQLEKRYQHQLEIEKQKNVLSPLLPQRAPHGSPQHRELSRQRRNSWHCISPYQDFEIPERKSESVVNGDLPSGSDYYEHDPSLMNELPESLRVENLEKQNDSDETQDDEFSDYEDMSGGVSVDEDSRELIQKKVGEYRERMLQLYKEKSGARIAAIEREYRSQINEVKGKLEDKASGKMAQLENKIENLEGQLEVQTLV